MNDVTGVDEDVFTVGKTTFQMSVSMSASLSASLDFINLTFASFSSLLWVFF